jgi:LysR family hydrogen peroxide-inducible transcriptional activator
MGPAIGEARWGDAIAEAFVRLQRIITIFSIAFFDYKRCMKLIPTLRQLRYLVAVVDRRHFGQAAEACLVSQSTLSAAIQELEDLLGAPLLERTKRSVLPTPLGLEIAERGRALLKGAEDIADIAAAAREPMSGPLRLGMIPTIGPFIVPRAMPELRKRFPKLKLFLREDQTARLLSQLEHGEIDGALIALPYPIDTLEVATVARDRFCVLFPPNHRKAQAARVKASELALEELLLLEEGHCLRDHALAACSLESARRNEGFKGTSLHTLVQMVANGLGVTLLPQVALDAGILRGLKLPVLTLDADTPYRDIGLVWRRGSGQARTLAAVAGAFKEIWPA